MLHPMLAKWTPGFYLLLGRLFALMLLTALLQAQPPILRFTSVEIRDAPPFPLVDCIFQDSRGFMWMGTYGGLYQYDGYTITHYFRNPGDTSGLGDNRVRSIFEDHHGNLWLGTQLGLHFLDVRSGEFRSFTGQEYLIERTIINKIVGDTRGRLWISTNQKIYQVSAADLKFEEILSTPVGEGSFVRDLAVDDRGDLWMTIGQQLLRREGISNQIDDITPENLITHIGEIKRILPDNDGSLWLVGTAGIGQYQPESHKMIRFISIEELNSNDFLNPSVVLRGDQLIVAGNGIVHVDLSTGEYTRQPVDLEDPDNLAKNRSTSIYLNNQDQLWIGNVSGRPYHCDLSKRYFHFVHVDLFEPIKGVQLLYELYEIWPGYLLFPRSDGLHLLEYRTGKTERFPYKPSFRSTNWFQGATTYLEEGTNLWIGTGRGLFLFDKSQRKFIDFGEGLTGFELLQQFAVRDILRDSHGYLWVATWASGVFKIDFLEGRVISYTFPSTAIYSDNNSCRSLYEDRAGHIWIGTRTGLLKYFPQLDSFRVYRHVEDDPFSMSESTAFCIYEDTLGYIWSGSYGGGLNRLDPVSEQFQHITVREGLLNNNIFSLVPDRQGNLWLLSFDGITRLNPYTRQIDHFTYDDGLGNRGYDGFLYGKSPYTGELFFGGRQGIDIFHPDSITISDYKPPLHLTGFQLFNEPVPIGPDKTSNDGQFYLDQHISGIREINLPFDQRVITFEYAALDFTGPENIQYAYQLEGFDADWQYVQNKRSVTYTNLDPGDYTFKVKSTNADGVWNDTFTALGLMVIPPWWATWWAYLLYMVLVVTMLFAFYYYQKRRWALQAALQLQERETGRLKELDTLKTNLYTNITHEFRTPLTVISGMAELVRSQPKEWMAKGTLLIEDHSRKLLNMVNQMLDLQKIEAGKMELRPVHSEIIAFLNYLAESFQFMARSKDVAFLIEHDVDFFSMDFDPEKVAGVASNLLSNAIKYTPKGKVVLKTRVEEGDWFIIEIIDTGMGIPPEKIDIIFDRFYQVEQGSTRRGEGTGIGLALVKEFIRLMQGNIEVDSHPDRGSRFTVRLPVTHQAAPAATDLRLGVEAILPLNEAIPVDSETGNNQETGGQILIVEDNPDVRRYLRVLLQDLYQIVEAADGEAGVRMSLELVPDLIICDVMMPGMDGFMVCRMLREDDLTTHIPVILLTARADLTSKVEGLAQGADAYLTKPFLPVELLAQISMLLKQRARLQQIYRQQIKEDVVPMTAAPADPLLSKLDDLLLSQISNEMLDIQQICRRLGVSRSQLHNKIKALTGLSTSIFIRRIRLREARRLIRNTDLNISEIAYSVGFKDPNFFSRVYRNEFGESPREGRG